MATITVNPGDDIQSAINTANAGDTIIVSSGTYTENVNINKSLTILGANAGISGSGARGAESTLEGNITIAANGITIDGMAFDGGASAIRGESGANAYDDLTIRNNLIENTIDSAIRLGLGTGGGIGSENWTIENNRIDNIVGNALTGMVLFNVDGLTVTGNVINHTNSSSTGRRGINLDGVLNATVTDNEIDMGLVAPTDVTVANTASPWGIQISMSDRAVENVNVSNNVVSGTNSGIIGLSQRSMVNVDITGNTVTDVVSGIVLNTGGVAPVTPGVTMDVDVTGNTITAAINAIRVRDLHDAHPNGPVTFNGLDVTGNTVNQGFVQIGGAETFFVSPATEPGDGLLNITGTTTIDGSANNDTVRVEGMGAVTFDGGDGTDTFIGGDGNDTIIGFAGADTVDGGDGTDTIVLTDTSDDLNNASDSQIVNVEAIDASTATAGVIIDIFSQTEGFTIKGGAGDDTLTGGSGNDFFIGGSGNDTVVFDGLFSDYSIETKSGFVFVTDNRGGSPNNGIDKISSDVENLQFSDKTIPSTFSFGSTGNDVIDFSTATTSVLVNAGTGKDTIIGGSGNDILNGGAGNDTLNGNAGDDELSGGSGSDTLNGGLGNDNLFGGSGNDLLLSDAGDDLLDGGTGVDTIKAEALSSADVTFTLTNTSFVGTGLGEDELVSIEQAILNGGAGNDVLNASAFTRGKVELTGGVGNDTLIGGRGNDILAGGDGNDRFGFGIGSAFPSVIGIGKDTVQDFTAGQDVIVLSKATFTALTTTATGTFTSGGTQISSNDFAVINVAQTSEVTTAGNSTALIIYNEQTGNLFYNQNKGSSGFGTGGQFATITGAPTLTAADIRIVV